MTVKEKTTNSTENIPLESKSSRGRKAGAIPFPRNSLLDALRVPKSIWDDNAGRPFPVGDLASKLGNSPTSSGFRDLVRSASRYGLIEGSWVQDVTKPIALSNLGMSIVAPKIGEDVNAYMRQALEMPEVFKGFLGAVNGRVIPPADVCKSSLIRDQHVLREEVDDCYEVLRKNIEELKLAQDTPQGKSYLRLDKLSSTQLIVQTEQEGETTEDVTEEIPIQPPATIPDTQTKQIPKQIFVAHGKNTKPLEQLEKILNKFKVNYKVAVEEPHSGRPVSTKVADLMKNCTSGIFIFTADEKTIDAEGNEIWRPSDNVVYELGAASVLYGSKIVIFKESDVKFASDYSDLGYISFEKDKLEAKAADLMIELINLGFVQLTPT
ncbi:MAG: nucleotide-binding protein [Patescibacteria group bacterium]|nr:nucleotide-binding protein [Patescibacteria group bacterium]